MRLTAEEIQMFLELLQDKHGFGYSKDPKIGKLQAKLSMMLELAARSGAPLEEGE